MDPYENPESQGKKTLWIIGGIILVVMLIALIYGISQNNLLKNTPAHTTDTDAVIPQQKIQPLSDKESVITPVTTKKLEVVNLETHPPQVQAHVAYTLTDTCAVLDTPEITSAGTTYTISLTARTPLEKKSSCIQQTTPGDIVVHLPVPQEASGNYTVLVGKQKTSFHVSATAAALPYGDK